MNQSEYQALQDQVARLLATNPQPGSADHQRLELLRHRVCLNGAALSGRPLPDPSRYVRLLEKVLLGAVAVVELLGELPGTMP